MEKSGLNETDLVKKMQEPIGKPVSFTYPLGEKRRRGVLKDRSITRSNAEHPDEVPYWNVADLIEFSGEPERWLRFGYYRMPKGRLNWASQTTATFRFSEWRRLMVKAAKEKPWFRELLQDVMRDSQRERKASQGSRQAET